MGEDGSGDEALDGVSGLYTEPEPDPSTTDPGTGGDAPGADPTNLSDDERLTRAGTYYTNGQFQEAIDIVKPIVDNQSSANWGRAAYGAVMCYDMLSDFANAGQLMQRIYDAHHAANEVGYRAQLDCYQGANPQHWQGDYLLY